MVTLWNITGLYPKAGRTEDGPSILNNAKTILPDYSQYRYVRENPIYVNKKNTPTQILRVACSDKETRLEMEVEATYANCRMFVQGKAYIKGNKGGKLGLASVENISVAPAVTCYRSYDHSILNAIFLVFVSLPKVKLYNR